MRNNNNNNNNYNNSNQQADINKSTMPIDNSNDNFTAVVKKIERILTSSSQTISSSDQVQIKSQKIIKKKPNCLNHQIDLKF
jgi:hypothetical protein